MPTASASPTKLLIATTSAGKLREWRDLLVGLPYTLLTLQDAGVDFDVEETGRTFRANALLKAAAYGSATGLLTLAEDSGLTVAALGGKPGVRSARWEGDDYAHKNRLLIHLLAGKQGQQRTCAYVCAVALRAPDGGKTWTFQGSVRGQIATEPQGSGGFGYDPIFLVPRLGRTLAELPPQEKNRLSHRAHAARRLRTTLLKSACLHQKTS